MAVGLEPWTISLQHYAEPPCGTVCCIAGETVLCADRRLGAELRDLNSTTLCNWHLVERNAAHLLGLTPAQADRLFYPVHWDLQFRQRLWDCNPGTPAYARVTADYIDSFIERGSS